MPAPTDHRIRQIIVTRHQQGKTLRAISRDLNMSYETVKKIWQHWIKTGQLEPNYRQAKQQGTRRYRAIAEQALQMKRDHPGWGATLIRLELATAQPATALPGVRTFQRWFRQAGVNRSAAERQSGERHIQRGDSVHQVWAVDAKEHMHLDDDSWASWLVITDEASGAVLHTAVFPPPALEPGATDSGPGTVSDCL